ncbi:zinc finger HIT domain-containing protein [Sporobolomyces salmoneus]|uniref:zinc finger HIT domain-containing protein n=1 Tax=Sporobolomyces salmoneus TaxID=183962 RepID=UPI00317923E5
MQIRLPRPKDQEPRRKRPPIVSTADNPICAICNRQISRYHCPTCNLPYCSLACYKSPQHEDCSEKFDRQTLLDEIKTAEGKTNEEKKAMMDMLKRFEEENAELEEGEEDEGNDLEREELEKRLEGIDLDSLPPEELLAFLSPSQQAAFNSTLSDPHQIDKLVTQELETEQPWWIAQDEDDLNEEEDLETEQTRRPPLVDFSKLPPLPLGDDGTPKTSPLLVYNVVTVLLAYSYTLRSFALSSFASLSPNSSERIPATQLLAQLVPFLVERSNTTLSSLDNAIKYVASREDSILTNPVLISLLLHDLSSLLKPAAVTEASAESSSESPLASHPTVSILHAISDLHTLFAAVSSPSSTTESSSSKPSLIARPSSTPTLSKTQRSQATMASHKLLFYCSLLSHPRTPIDIRLISSISDRAERTANAREMEVMEREESARQQREDQSSKFLVREQGGSRGGQEEETAGSRIVEIE